MQQVVPQQSVPVQSAPAVEEPRIVRPSTTPSTQTLPSTGNTPGGVDR